MKKFIKNILRKTLLPEVQRTKSTLETHSRLGEAMLSERSFYFGTKRMRVKSLAMEAAPGTAETVIEVLKSLNKESKILDFGCGQHQSKYLKSFGFDVHSADIFDFKIPNFTQIDPTSDRLPFSDKQFDVCVVSEVIEHVESPWQLLKELSRVTKNYLLVTTPNTVSKKSRQNFFQTGYLFWFGPENFSYHISPVFEWQMRLFCQRHNFTLAEFLANHRAFMLDDKNKPLDYAEALIFKINLNA